MVGGLDHQLFLAMVLCICCTWVLFLSNRFLEVQVWRAYSVCNSCKYSRVIGGNPVMLCIHIAQSLVNLPGKFRKHSVVAELVSRCSLLGKITDS